MSTTSCMPPPRTLSYTPPYYTHLPQHSFTRAHGQRVAILSEQTQPLHSEDKSSLSYTVDARHFCPHHVRFRTPPLIPLTSPSTPRLGHTEHAAPVNLNTRKLSIRATKVKSVYARILSNVYCVLPTTSGPSLHPPPSATPGPICFC